MTKPAAASQSDYLRLVEQLVAAGCARDFAEKEARRRLPELVSEKPDANQLEKVTQRAVIKRFTAYGFRVYSLSQPRASKQTPGLPDLWCMHERLAICFWWETKRPVGGRYSDVQVEFAAMAKRCGIGYGSGDQNDAEEHLIALGLAQRVGGYLEPTRLLRASRGFVPDGAVLTINEASA